MKTVAEKVLIFTLLAAIIGLTGLSGFAQEVSNPYGEDDPLSQQRANKKHDRITITIDIATSAKSEASTETSKESTFKWAFNRIFKIDKDRDGDIIAQAFPASRLPNLDVKTEREHTGEGETAVNYSTKLTISGEVVDVRPNGQLVVEARRTIRIQNEERTVLFTGRVDPKDLSASSTVDAKNVMNFTVKLLGQGDVSDAVKRGWLAKAFEFFSPF